MMDADANRLSRQEHQDLRDLVVAGAGLILARRARRTRIIGTATAILTVGAVSAATLIFALDRREPDPVSTVDPTPDVRAGISGFAAGTGHNSDIYFSVSGGEPRVALGADMDDRLTCPAFAPDGTKLAVGSGSNRILVASVSSTGRVAVTEEFEFVEGGQDPCPMWSADGRWLAVGVGGIPSSFPYDDAEASKEVIVIDTLSGAIDRIDAQATDLEWAPGDNRLFIADEGLHVYSPDSGVYSDVLDTDDVKLFTLSPDGRSLAAQRRTTSTGGYASWWELVVMGVDGSDQRVVVGDFPVDRAVSPEWSPDGNRIAFLRRFEDYPGPRGGPPNYSELRVIDVPGLENGDLSGESVAIHPATTSEDGQTTNWLPAGGIAWSPDSRSLRFTAWNYSTGPGWSGGWEHVESGTGIVDAPVDGSEADIVYAGDVQLYSNIPWTAHQSWRAPGPD